MTCRVSELISEERLPLFVYGTLMYPHVVNTLLPSSRPRSLRKAVLSGYERRQVKGQSYPAIIESASSETRGELIELESIQELQVLDDYETEDYERAQVKVTIETDGSTLEAFCYRWIGTTEKLSLNDWNIDDFERKLKENKLDIYD